VRDVRAQRVVIASVLFGVIASGVFAQLQICAWNVISAQVNASHISFS